MARPDCVHRDLEGPRGRTADGDRLNVDGDGQGDLKGHGGVNRAVFVYQIESYRYWQEQLDRHDFVYGQFGENFTVEGMADDEVCIGDRYRIGEGIFEVSQPRVTCYRLGLRMDEPRMPSLVVAHHRPGFYLRTIQEGRVRAGDAIHKIAAGPGAMTVAEIDALLYLPHRTRASLIRAVRIPALSEGWRGSFRDLLDEAEANGPSAPAPPPAWSGLRPLCVEAVEPESATVVSIRLRPQEGDAAPPALPGQFLTLRVAPDPAAGPLMRTYSLTGPQNGREYRISVKREPHGAASGYLQTRLRAGDVLQAAAPRGSFVLAPGSRPVVLISAGVGATPVLAMLHALAAERGERPVWWLHGARDRAEHVFRAEVAELLAALPGAYRIVCYSRPGPDDRPGRDFDVAGRLDGAVIDDHDVPVDADFYICGPGAFMHDITAALAARGAARAACAARSSDRATRALRGWWRPAPRRRRTPRRANLPPAGSSRSHAATSRCHGIRRSDRSSSSPRHATCPSAGPVAPVSATPARPGWCQARWTTRPSPWSPPSPARRSSAARRPGAS